MRLRGKGEIIYKQNKAKMTVAHPPALILQVLQ